MDASTDSSSRKRHIDEISEDLPKEPLLTPDNRRFHLYPIRYPAVWDMYKTHQSSPWTAEEIPLEVDKVQWQDKLNDDERYFIEHILAFFASSDGIVNENLATKFLNEVQIPEAKFFYGNQIAMENVHSETYALLIESLVTDTEKKRKLFNAIEEVECVKKKANWALKWINNKNSFGERIVAFAAVEGIFFSGSFCSIFWLKKRGLMPGLCFSNELISKDEALHCDFAILLFSMLLQKPSPEAILSIICQAVECEEEFISEALPVSLIGMNSTTMKQYIRFVANRLLICFGLPAHYKATNPYEWMDLQSLPGKSNFFERKTPEYRKAGVAQGELQRSFSTEAPF